MGMYDMAPETIEEQKLYRPMGLNDAEYSRVKELLGRLPNQVETGIFSAMWSEHCSYKTSKPLLKMFPSDGPQVLQGPGEGAGVIDAGDGLALVFKMESHNSPSAVEPFEGAATGVGGIVRDVFSMGAEPIALLNALRFGNLEHERSQFLVREVVRGIAHYGNNLEVPTVGGEIQFEDSFKENPLVNAMCVGLLSHDGVRKGVAGSPGNSVIYAGRDTGRDGIHGATFSSATREDDTDDTGAVALGDPLVEKRLIEACLEAAGSDAFIGMQDMGAAGLTSSASEMASASGRGMTLDLDYVPQRERDMDAYELMLSESQERMLLVVEQGREKEIIDIFKRHELEAATIGRVTEDTGFRIMQHGEVRADIPVEMLVDEAPVLDMPSQMPGHVAANRELTADMPLVADYERALQEILQHPTIASKEWVYNQFQTDTGNRTIQPPGSSAGVVRIADDRSIALTTDCPSRYIYLDPEEGGKIAVAEAARNIACSGAHPLALTDGLNYGDPTDPEVYWQMEKSIAGISRASKTLKTPVVSGNVSMYNESEGEAIYPTPIVGMAGVHESLEYITPSAFQQAGDWIYVLGENKGEFGGSILQYIKDGLYAGRIPQIDLDKEKERQATLLKLIEDGLIQSAHDVSDGGLAVTLSECTVQSNKLGMDVRIGMHPTAALFSETQSRMVLSVAEVNREAFEAACPDAEAIGRVISEDRFIIRDQGEAIIDLEVEVINNWWRDALASMLKSQT